jgi:cytochrome b subunit of formate dehydrogenase
MDTTHRPATPAILARLLLPIFAALILAFAGSAGAQTLTTAECLDCHKDASLTKDVNGKTVSVSVNADKFQQSIHGQALGCTDCHADVRAYPHEPKPHPVSCATCHPDAQAAWENSSHAKAIASGNAQAAHCIDCHGSPHEIVPASDPKSPVAHKNIPMTCGRCHGQKFVMEKAGLSTQPFTSYQQSVHGLAVANNNTRAAVCTDCHDHHAIFGAENPQSAIFKFNVPRLCAKCHAPIAAQYTQSVHGKAIAHGRWNAPVCTDCHGIHNIKSPKDPSSPVAPANVATATCAQCHTGVRLSQEWGVPGNRAETYGASYHGLARQLGSKVAANCASCHGIHNILPSNDPRSSTNKANLRKTCGKCHDGASKKFVEGRIHLREGEQVDTQSKVVSFIRRIYLWLIFLTIGGMLAHNIMLWVRKTLIARRAPGRTIRRMSRNQRVQHFMLLSSFIVLVLTGFALKYPASPFAWLFGSSEEPRRIIHRIAAVVMIALGFYHVAYMVGTKEGRKGLRDFWFTLKDARDATDQVKFGLGVSNHPARMGRFTYGEKAEYWAVVWGTIVMGVTGLMIWYNVATTNWMPRWWIDVATTIHFYEAVLATLAIIVWHFYNIFFDPDIYPMNWAWFDGKISDHFYKHEHAADYERAKREAESQEHD